jgi:hypothetical protein
LHRYFWVLSEIFGTILAQIRNLTDDPIQALKVSFPCLRARALQRAGVKLVLAKAGNANPETKNQYLWISAGVYPVAERGRNNKLEEQ